MVRSFGAPVIEPGGKQERTASRGRGAGPQPAPHRGDQLVDGLVGLDRHHLRHLDAADLADGAEVVAQEVDDHQVLGPVLLVGGEGGGEGCVFGGGRAAAAGALDRACFGFAVAADAEEALGGGAEDG